MEVKEIKEDEVLEGTANDQLDERFGERLKIGRLTTRDSKYPHIVIVGLNYTASVLIIGATIQLVQN